MKFELFIQVKNGGFVWNIKKTLGGLSVSKKISDLFPNDDIDPDTIMHDYIWIQTDYRYITIPEEVARSSGLFWKKSVRRLYVPENALNHYTVVRVDCVRREKKADVRTVWTEIALDEKRLIDDWIAAGYPKKWTVPEQTKPYEIPFVRGRMTRDGYGEVEWI